jgi:predicted phage baseplate assembly protein
MAFHASYRIGNGPAGNVGRDAISCLVLRGAMWSGPVVSPRNPIAASGGVAPEPVGEAKLFAPFAFRNQLKRAITAGDYAAIAGADNALQRAAARMRWNGSWYEAQVAIDPLAAFQDDAALPGAVARRLYPYRRIGHDLRVVQASYVALDIELTVCVADHYARGAVRAVLLGLFGSAGLFHPDQLTFGGAIYESRLVAAAQAVDGVEHVEVTRLRRLHQLPASGPVPPILPMGEMEIARMDNDPNYPERGILKLIMRGGR